MSVRIFLSTDGCVFGSTGSRTLFMSGYTEFALIDDCSEQQ